MQKQLQKEKNTRDDPTFDKELNFAMLPLIIRFKIDYINVCKIRTILSRNLVLKVPLKFIMAQLQTSTLDDYTKTIHRSRISDFHRMRELKKHVIKLIKRELRTRNLTASKKCE